MTEGLKWTVNEVPKSDDKHLELMSEENVKKANEFHRSFPQYSVTPLQNLSSLAKYLGVKNIFCKDESYRFGLNAFKVLGGSYAMGRYIAKELGRDISELPYNVLSSDKLREEFGQATFFTATDGNHGRGVAWAANRLGQKAVVRMPKGTTKTRFDNIAKEGATVTIEEVNYDDCVRMAAAEAAKTEHGIIVQDTAWDGYEEIPSWIMQGYGTLVLEADQQLKEMGVERPTKGTFRFQAEVSKDDLKYIKSGGEVILKGADEKEITGAKVESVKEDSSNENQYILSVQVPEGTLSIGDTAEFTISQDAGPFNVCVPLSALYEENGRYYVYVTDTQNTVLGEVLVARKTYVNVKDKNSSTAALENGDLSSDQKIVTSSDREISSGSRIRLLEE